MTQEVIRIKVESPIIISHRTSEVILIITCHRTVDVVHGLFRQQMDTLIEIFLTLLPVLTSQTDDSPLSPDATVVRIKFQTLVKRCHCLGGIFLKQIYLSLHGIGTCVFGPTGNHRVNLGQGKLIVLVLDQTEDPVVPKALVLRIITKCTIIVFHSIGIFLLINATKTSQLVGTHHIRIALDSYRAIIFSPTEIIEVKFRHPSEEPGLKEPRLLTDGLIKILDGEHIVLIVESRAPHHHQTVGIKLGKTNQRQED